MPEVDLVFWQRRMVDAAYPGNVLQRALAVPNARLAYLARIAFGEHDYQVFYNDLLAAMQCLQRAERRSLDLLVRRHDPKFLHLPVHGRAADVQLSRYSSHIPLVIPQGPQ